MLLSKWEVDDGFEECFAYLEPGLNPLLRIRIVRTIDNIFIPVIRIHENGMMVVSSDVGNILKSEAKKRAIKLAQTYLKFNINRIEIRRNEMKNIIKKAILRQPITLQDIAEELYEICDRVHASCDDECPIYEANNHKIPWNKDLSNCICFKDGKKMLKYLDYHSIK